MGTCICKRISKTSTKVQTGVTASNSPDALVNPPPVPSAMNKVIPRDIIKEPDPMKNEKLVRISAANVSSVLKVKIETEDRVQSGRRRSNKNPSRVFPGESTVQKQPVSDVFGLDSSRYLIEENLSGQGNPQTPKPRLNKPSPIDNQPTESLDPKPTISNWQAKLQQTPASSHDRLVAESSLRIISQATPVRIINTIDESQKEYEHNHEGPDLDCDNSNEGKSIFDMVLNNGRKEYSRKTKRSSVNISMDKDSKSNQSANEKTPKKTMKLHHNFAKDHHRGITKDANSSLFWANFRKRNKTDTEIGKGSSESTARLFSDMSPRRELTPTPKGPKQGGSQHKIETSIQMGEKTMTTIVKITSSPRSSKKMHKVEIVTFSPHHWKAVPKLESAQERFVIQQELNELRPHSREKNNQTITEHYSLENQDSLKSNEKADEDEGASGAEGRTGKRRNSEGPETERRLSAVQRHLHFEEQATNQRPTSPASHNIATRSYQTHF